MKKKLYSQVTPGRGYKACDSGSTFTNIGVCGHVAVSVAKAFQCFCSAIKSLVPFLPHCRIAFQNPELIKYISTRSGRLFQPFTVPWPLFKFFFSMPSSSWFLLHTEQTSTQLSIIHSVHDLIGLYHVSQGCSHGGHMGGLRPPKIQLDTPN